jgi:hypothetical protein
MAGFENLETFVPTTVVPGSLKRRMLGTHGNYVHRLQKSK